MQGLSVQRGASGDSGRRVQLAFQGNAQAFREQAANQWGLGDAADQHQPAHVVARQPIAFEEAFADFNGPTDLGQDDAVQLLAVDGDFALERLPARVDQAWGEA